MPIGPATMFVTTSAKAFSSNLDESSTQGENREAKRHWKSAFA